MATQRNRATEVLASCGLGHLHVSSIKPMNGGMCNQVEEWFTDGEPSSVVCKVGNNSGDNRDVVEHGLSREAFILNWMKEQSELPVPAVYGWVPKGEISYLLLERLPGKNLGDARLTDKGIETFYEDLAGHIGRLHKNRGESFGFIVDDDQTSTWLDWFGPRLQENFEDTKSRLSGETCENIRQLLDNLPMWIPEPPAPVLVHGDLWHTNIIVDDIDLDHPTITGFIDGGGLYADPEYELSYLLAFGMVDEGFFHFYEQWHVVRDGFYTRCRIYWLNTMLLHLWLFGEKYLDRCERLAQEINDIMWR